MKIKGKVLSLQTGLQTDKLLAGVPHLDFLYQMPFHQTGSHVTIIMEP
jgi:hypothetical protein